jgi:hypothetical protein
MSGSASARNKKTLLTLVLVHTVASLLHFVHNAQFLADYPNMPAWLSPGEIYGVWLSEAAIGACGLILFLRGRLAGLWIIALYGLLGLAGLDHYTRAPMDAHTFAMNLTIWIETATAVVLLAFVATLLASRQRTEGPID